MGMKKTGITIWLNILIKLHKAMIELNKCELCTFQSMNMVLLHVRNQ